MILAGAAVTVVIGRDMQDLVQRKMSPHLHDRIVMIPNWSDERRVHHVPAAANAFRQEHRLDGRFVVQYAGRLGQKHNLEPLIDAARLLSDTRALFQFVGDGDKKPKLEALAADLGLENVQFLPYQPMERLAEMLSAADVAVVCLESGHTGDQRPEQGLRGYRERDSDSSASSIPMARSARWSRRLVAASWSIRWGRRSLG